LEHIVNQLEAIIDQAWTENAKNQESPNTPSNGGQKNVAIPSITTGYQEV